MEAGGPISEGGASAYTCSRVAWAGPFPSPWGKGSSCTLSYGPLPSSPYPLLQVRELRCREVKTLAQAYPPASRF